MTVDSESLPGLCFPPGYTRRMRIGDLSAFARVPEQVDVDAGERRVDGQARALRTPCSAAAEQVGTQ